MKKADFLVNDLIAIETALIQQVDYCEELIGDPSFDPVLNFRVKESLRHSKSALKKVQKILKDYPH